MHNANSQHSHEDDGILRDGERIRVPMRLADGRTVADARLPPNATVLADGSVKQMFDDGTAMLIVEGQTVYLDAAGNRAKSLSLVQQAHSAGSAGRFDLVDRHAHVIAARAGYERHLGDAWR